VIWRRFCEPSGALIAVVDAGPLYAAADENDVDHDACFEVLQRRDLDLVVPALVVAKVCYFLENRMGPSAEARFLRGLASLDVQAPFPAEWPAIASLVETYRDFPLGGADASVVVLAERLDTEILVTLDRRHFGALRRSDGRPFRLLPE
jgi:predicted nucleic acid-binding protein